MTATRKLAVLLFRVFRKIFSFNTTRGLMSDI